MYIYGDICVYETIIFMHACKIISVHIKNLSPSIIKYKGVGVCMGAKDDF